MERNKREISHPYVYMRNEHDYWLYYYYCNININIDAAEFSFIAIFFFSRDNTAPKSNQSKPILNPTHWPMTSGILLHLHLMLFSFHHFTSQSHVFIYGKIPMYIMKINSIINKITKNLKNLEIYIYIWKFSKKKLRRLIWEFSKNFYVYNEN